RLDEDVRPGDELRAESVGRRPGEGRLLLPHDGLRARALAQELLDPVEEMVALRLRDVEQRDDLAVEARRPGRGLPRYGDRGGRVEVFVHGSSSRLWRANASKHERRALRERPAGHDRREPSRAPAGDDELDVLR